MLIRFIRCGLLLFSVCTGIEGSDQLGIQVLRGESANNNVASATSVSPIVRVTDAAGRPVPGTLVVFTAPSTGASVDFSGMGNAAAIVTDRGGTAAAPHIKPTHANGPVEIAVMASKQGVVGNSLIHQMNLGLNDPDLDPEYIDIVAARGLRSIGNMAHGETPQRSVIIRVVNGSGVPMACAQIQVALVKVKASGKRDEVARAAGVCTQAGEFQAELRSKSKRDTLQLFVQVRSGGRAATRYFSVDP